MCSKSHLLLHKHVSKQKEQEGKKEVRILQKKIGLKATQKYVSIFSSDKFQ